MEINKNILDPLQKIKPTQPPKYLLEKIQQKIKNEKASLITISSFSLGIAALFCVNVYVVLKLEKDNSINHSVSIKKSVYQSNQLYDE